MNWKRTKTVNIESKMCHIYNRLETIEIWTISPEPITEVMAFAPSYGKSVYSYIDYYI